ncbi:MAG: cation transporter [Rhodocyclaceae bacterium]|nr:cation transporter [Rhodocyclaceae bacterium]
MAHDHGHHHHHGPASRGYGRAFLVGIALNLGFVGVEWTAGVIAQSLALMADATHNLGDVLGLVLAWGASVLARRRPSERYTYGLRGSSILAALANAVILLLVTGGLAWEAMQRFDAPRPVEGGLMMAVAAVGVLVNGVTAWLFMAGGKEDLNLRGAYLHMAADAAVSLGVVVAGGLVMATGWGWLDPAVTLAVVAVIAAGTWGLLRDSLALALQAVPGGIETAEVRAWLAGLPGVAEVHDLHIWGMSTTETALTVHLVFPAGHPGDAFIGGVAHDIGHRFQIHHVTIQVELADGGPCALAPDHVV